MLWQVRKVLRRVRFTHLAWIRREIIIWSRTGEEELLLETETPGLRPPHLAHLSVVVGGAQALLHHLAGTINTRLSHTTSWQHSVQNHQGHLTYQNTRERTFFTLPRSKSTCDTVLRGDWRQEAGVWSSGRTLAKAYLSRKVSSLARVTTSRRSRAATRSIPTEGEGARH